MARGAVITEAALITCDGPQQADAINRLVGSIVGSSKRQFASILVTKRRDNLTRNRGENRRLRRSLGVALTSPISAIAIHNSAAMSQEMIEALPYQRFSFASRAEMRCACPGWPLPNTAFLNSASSVVSPSCFCSMRESDAVTPSRQFMSRPRDRHSRDGSDNSCATYLGHAVARASEPANTERFVVVHFRPSLNLLARGTNLGIVA